MRFLAGDNKCPICKVESEKVIITKRPDHYLNISEDVGKELQVDLKDQTKENYYQANFGLKWDAWGTYA